MDDKALLPAIKNNDMHFVMNIICKPTLTL